MKHFSKVVMLLLLVVMAVLIVACGAQPAPETVVETVVVETEKEVKVVETVEVEKEVVKEVEVEKEVVKEVQPVIYTSYRSNTAERAVDEMMVELYNQQNPDNPVQLTTVNHEDFKQAIRAFLVADPAPDVMTWFSGNRAVFFIEKGLILDIDDVWEEQGWNETYPRSFRTLSEYEGKAYFVPTQFNWWAVWYRKPIFEEYGVTPPETWDELLATCDTFNEAGITPFAIGTKYRWTAAGWFDYLNMRMNGPQFHLDLMLGKEKYDDPRVRDVFVKWRELFDHNCFLENAAAYDWQEGLQPLLQGDAAMYLLGDYLMDSVPDDMKDEMAFSRFPIIDPSIPIGEDTGVDGYFMSVSAKNVEGGKKFLAFMGSAEAQSILAKEMGRLTPHPDVDPALYTPMQQQALDMIRDTDMVLQFYDRDTTPEMADVGMNGMMAFWDDPYNDEALDEILAELETARQEIFAEE